MKPRRAFGVEPDALPDRRLSRPVAARECLVDDDDGQRRGGVTLVERPSFHDARAER